MNIVELYKKSYSGVAREIWLLALISFINRAGSMILPFITIYLNTVKGYSLSVTGLVMMCFGVGSFFGNWLGGVLCDRVGPFRLQFFSLFSCGIGYLILMWMDSPLTIGLGLFVSSLLSEMFRPANMASIGLIANEENRTKAVGITRLAFNLGFTAGPAIGGLIAANYGYNWIFIIDGGTCILAALSFILVFGSQIKKESKITVDKNTDHEPKPHLRQVLQDKTYMFFVFLLFVYGVIFMQQFTTVPVYLKKELMYSEDYIGFIMAMNGLLIVLIEMPMIVYFERKGLMKMMTFGTSIIGLSYFLFLPANHAAWIWMATILFTIGEVFSLPFATTVVLNRSTDKLRGRYMAMYGMAFSLCHIVSPAFGMFIADNFNFSTLWIIVGLLMLLIAYGFYSLRNLLTGIRKNID
jgi:predicted MFS family arabinose efflux permease